MDKNKEKKMTMFRNVLIGMTVLIILFTIMAVVDGGLDLFTPFLGPVFAMNWQGQFNVDFSTYLVLSGIWMAWRSGFSRGGLILGICASAIRRYLKEKEKDDHGCRYKYYC